MKEQLEIIEVQHYPCLKYSVRYYDIERKEFMSLACSWAFSEQAQAWINVQGKAV